MNYNCFASIVKLTVKTCKNSRTLTRDVRSLHLMFVRTFDSRVASTATGCLESSKYGNTMLLKGCIRAMSKDSKKTRKPPKTSAGLEHDYGDDEIEENESKWAEQDEDADEPGKDYKDIVANVGSMRLDNILKAGLGLSKNKIETAFYESKLRLNGAKALKKSAVIKLGDEADVVLGVNAKNENFLDVSRVVVRGILDNKLSQHTKVKLRRYKRLIIQNYPDRWKKIDNENS